MNRMFLLLILLAGLILAACSAPTTYPAPQPLSLYEGYEAKDSSTVSIAVSATGTSHIARTQCDEDTGVNCRLVFQSIRAGKIINEDFWDPPAGFSYHDPDITLVGDIPFVVMNYCQDGSIVCVPTYARPNYLDSTYFLDSGFPTKNPPLVVSRSGYVYAVHEVPLSATGNGLRFCYLPFSPSDEPVCGWVSPNPPDDPKARTFATADVDNTGHLHVGYLLKEAGQTVLYYANNTGDWDANMTDPANVHISKQTAVLPDTFLKPALSVQYDSGYVYLAVAKKISAVSDVIDVHYWPPLDSTDAHAYRMDLASDQEWNIYGGLSMTTWDPPYEGPSAEIAFASFESTHSCQTDIYTVRFTPGEAVNAPVRLYPTCLDSGKNDSDPIISIVGGFPAVGWHIYHSVNKTYDDVYFYGFGGQIIHQANWNGGRSLDMDGNGDNVAGIWNETQADGRLATWHAYNAHMIWLPMVKK